MQTQTVEESEQARPTSGRSLDWLAVGLYSLLTILITYPLAFELNSSMRGNGTSGDAYQNLWYMWWYGQALERGLDPTHTNLMYGLLPNVQVLVSSVLNGLLFWPVIRLVGAVAAYNLALLISFPLAGFFTYKLVGVVLPQRNWLAQFGAGFFFAFSTFHFYRLEGHLGLMTVQWLPFYLWRLLALKRRPNLANAALVGLGLALAGLSDLYYLGYFVLPVTVFWFGWYGLIAERKTFWQRANLVYQLGAVGFGLLLLIPFYSFFLSLDPDVRQAVSDRTDDVKNLSADGLAFLLPTAQNPLLGGATGPIYHQFRSLFPIEQAVFPGYLVTGLALSGLFVRSLRSRASFWLVLGGGAFVLALGPQLHLAGHEIGPAILPYRWLYGSLPLLNSFRSPNRLAVIVMLSLAVLTGLALSVWLPRLQTVLSRSGRVGWGRVGIGLLVGILLSLHLAESLTYSWPLTTGPVMVGPVYRQIAAEPGDFEVLELPLGTQSRPLYDQILHGKRLVGGVATRISNRMTASWDRATYLGMFNPAESSAVINNGQALKAPGGPDIFPLDLTFRQMLNGERIGYVTLRPGRAAFAWMKDYLIAQLGPPGWEETSEGEPLLAWRTLPLVAPLGPPAAGTYPIRLGDGWNAGLGKGDDGRLLRLVEQDGQLLVEAGSPGPARLTLTVTPYIRPQMVEVRQGGQTVGTIVGSQPWQPQTVTLPITLAPGPNLITLHSGQGCLHPVDYIPNSPDLRCIGFAVAGVQFSSP